MAAGRASAVAAGTARATHTSGAGRGRWESTLETLAATFPSLLADGSITADAAIRGRNRHVGHRKGRVDRGESDARAAEPSLSCTRAAGHIIQLR